MIIHNCEQGTEKWFECRRGKFTGSKFYPLMGTSKKNKTYLDILYRVAYERLSGKTVESGYKSKDMERGNEQEPDARLWYEVKNNIFVDQVGFIEHNEWVGISPDGLVEDSGMLEIKSAKENVQIHRLLKNELPSEHRYQIQGGLWVAEREWCDFVSYNPDLPKLQLRIYRDEKTIKELETRTSEAIEEVKELLTKLRA